jgi:hypothetical protein
VDDAGLTMMNEGEMNENEGAEEGESELPPVPLNHQVDGQSRPEV